MYYRIKNEIKEAMKNKDNLKKDCLRMVLDRAKNILKEKNPLDVPEVIPNEIIEQSVQKEIKQYNQTIDSLKGNELCDLYSETQYKMGILSTYLPKMMTSEEVDRAVYNILSGGAYDSLGLKMKACMSALKGKADNKVIKTAVEKYK